MIHYSCDRCKRLIETDDELRYVVRFEVQANFGDEELFSQGASHLLEMDDLLEDAEPEQPAIDDEFDGCQRFDLCSECYAAFRSDPLGRTSTRPVGFSDN